MRPSYHDVRAGWIVYHGAAPPPGGVFFIDDRSFEMRIMTTLPMDDLKKAGPAAKAHEAAGYDGVMTMENAHHPFLPLAVAAVALVAAIIALI